MPTYQYACTDCEHAFEQVQAFTDDTLTDCPECTGRLRKVFNAVGVVFKGSGFYRTDNRAKESSSASSSGSSASDSSSTTSSSDSGSSSSSESKSSDSGTTKTPVKSAAGTSS